MMCSNVRYLDSVYTISVCTSIIVYNTLCKPRRRVFDSSANKLTYLLTYVNNLFKNDEADIIWYNTTLAIHGVGTIIIGRNLINY